jgi:hypothetical protein
VDYSPNLWQALVGFHSRRLRRLAAAIFFGFKVINNQKTFLSKWLSLTHANMDVNCHIHVIELSLIEFFTKERSFS